jgi:hypothetical protein
MIANVVTRARVMDGAMLAAMLAAVPPAPCSPIITPSPRGEAAPAGISVTICTRRRR